MNSLKYPGLVVSRGPMTASTIYQADDDHLGGLLLTGGMDGPKVRDSVVIMLISLFKTLM